MTKNIHITIGKIQLKCYVKENLQTQILLEKTDNAINNQFKKLEQKAKLNKLKESKK